MKIPRGDTVGPERRSPRYHETYLALESVEERIKRERGALRLSIFINPHAS